MSSLDDQTPNLDSELDPKTGWALRHLHLFPLEVNRASYEELLRVPGVGVRSGSSADIACQASRAPGAG